MVPPQGDAAPPLGSLRIIASWEPEEGVRDLVIAALRGNQAETGHHDGMVLLHVPVVLEAADALDSFATPGEAPGNHGLLLTTASDGRLRRWRSLTEPTTRPSGAPGP